MISLHLQGKPFNITVILVYAPMSNAEETEVERFYEELQDLLKLTLEKDVLFILGDWNAKVGSQETPGVTDKFGLGIRNEAGKGYPLQYSVLENFMDCIVYGVAKSRTGLNNFHARKVFLHASNN